MLARTRVRFGPAGRAGGPPVLPDGRDHEIVRGPKSLKTALAILFACGLALLLGASAGSPRAGVASLSNGKTGSSSSASKIASNLASGGLQFASCMRSHGVPHYPDPTVSGGVTRSIVMGNAGASASVFQAAQKAC